MPLRLVQRTAASLLAALALGAAGAALAPPQGGYGLRELFESLMVLRDGHGARQLPQNDENTWRNP